MNHMCTELRKPRGTFFLFPGYWRFPIILLAMVVLTSCSTINRQAASKLAEQGVTTSSTIGQSYLKTQQQLFNYVEGEYLLSGLVANYSEPSSNMLASVQIVGDELGARQKMLKSLAGVYTSFGALCAYDAKGEVEKAVGQTVKAGNDLSTILGGGNISTAAGALFAKAGGEIVGLYQSTRIKAASMKIRNLLTGIVFLLEKQTEQNAMIAARKEIARGKLKVAEALWSNKIALADTILDEQVQAYGLTLDKEAAKLASKSAFLSKGVSNVLKWRHEQEESLIDLAYNNAIKALKELQNEHA